MELSLFLEEVLEHRIELVTVESLSPYIGPHILKEVEYVLGNIFLTHFFGYLPRNHARNGFCLNRFVFCAVNTATAISEWCD